MKWFYSASTGGFYSSEDHAESMPGDAVEITNEERIALLEGEQNGMLISPGEGGSPMLTEKPPVSLTREEVESIRLRAYADPVSGSDRFFAEVVRLQMTGGSAAEIEEARSAGAVRYSDIQAENPWPDQ